MVVVTTQCEAFPDVDLLLPNSACHDYNQAMQQPATFEQLGMNARQMTSVSTTISKEFGFDTAPTLLYSYPTFPELVNHVCEASRFLPDTVKRILCQILGGTLGRPFEPTTPTDTECAHELSHTCFG